MEKSIRIAICEDDETERGYICSLVRSWAKNNRRHCQVDGYASAEQLLYSFDDDFPYFFYLLDIQMGQMSGMELARRIRAKDKTAVIVFLTGLREYALEGYEVGALRYLMKPLREEDLYSLLSQAVAEYEDREETFFVWEQGSEVLRIPYADIWYLKANGHYIELLYWVRENTCHKLEWKASFGSVQAEFEQNGFVMVRRGILVNLQRIARIGKTECILDSGERLPISRNQYKKVNEAFIEWYRYAERR